MLDNAIAWCHSCNGYRSPRIFGLVSHSIYTAALADLFIDRWRWRSRVSNLPDSLLFITAALHDIGKAWRGYQRAAIDYCNNGKEPSFFLHELLSGTIIAAIASQADEHARISTEDILWRSLTMGIILHHHGMIRRYKTGIVSIIDGLFINGNLCKYWRDKNWCNESLTIVTLLEDALPYIKEVLERLLCLTRKLDRSIDQHLIEEMIKLTDFLKGLRLDEYKIIEYLKDLVKITVSNPRQAELSSIISILAGFTAVVDSASASIERTCSSTTKLPSGTYAYRVIREAFGEKTQELLQKRIEKASQCLKVK